MLLHTYTVAPLIIVLPAMRVMLPILINTRSGFVSTSRYPPTYVSAGSSSWAKTEFEYTRKNDPTVTSAGAFSDASTLLVLM